MGREGMGGIMQAANVVAVLDAIGGSEEDLERVLAIEAIWRELNPRDKDDND